MTVPVEQKPCFLEVMCTASISQTRISSYSSNSLAKHNHTCTDLQEVNREIRDGLAGRWRLSDSPCCMSTVYHNTQKQRRNSTSSERLISSLNFQHFTTPLQFQGRICASVPDRRYEDIGLRSTALHLVTCVYL